MSTTPDNGTVPLHPSEKWGADVMALFAAWEVGLAPQLFELRASMPIDRHFFAAYDQVLHNLKLFDSPDAIKDFVAKVKAVAESRVRRESDAITSFFERLQEHAVALSTAGVHGGDPVIFAEQLPGRLVQSPELRAVLMHAGRIPTEHPLADITPLRHQDTLWLAVGTNPDAKVFRYSLIKRATDVLRISIEREQQLRDEQNRRERREAMDKQNNTPDEIRRRQIDAEAARIKQQREEQNIKD